jgi:hypothetical protein
LWPPAWKFLPSIKVDKVTVTPEIKKREKSYKLQYRNQNLDELFLRLFVQVFKNCGNNGGGQNNFKYIPYFLN